MTAPDEPTQVDVRLRPEGELNRGAADPTETGTTKSDGTVSGSGVNQPRSGIFVRFRVFVAR